MVADSSAGRVPGYESLAAVLQAAYEQAARGKGAERHAGGQPFDEQPMQVISDLLGNVDGMAFQAIKKIREARGLPTVEAQVRELLGAINYCAGMVIFLQARAETAAVEQVTDAGGWIVWRGGDQPVRDGVIVDVKLRSGRMLVGVPADNVEFRWRWNWMDAISDIVAYRVLGSIDGGS